MKWIAASIALVAVAIVAVAVIIAKEHKTCQTVVVRNPGLYDSGTTRHEVCK
jgi:hypothetical protein